MYVIDLLDIPVCATWFKAYSMKLVHIVKPVGSCHMSCTCRSITMHTTYTYIFSLVILIIVLFFANIVFYLFHLQVEPVFTCVLK